jgi:hypothetical protein
VDGKGWKWGLGEVKMEDLVRGERGESEAQVLLRRSGIGEAGDEF